MRNTICPGRHLADERMNMRFTNVQSPKLLAPVVVLLLLLLFPACRQATVKGSPQDLELRAREIHKKIVTVDTHCDTAMWLLRGNWNPAERHDPAAPGSSKIDLPRMKEGGLDAEFFAAFVGQGPRTAEGYAQARKRTEELIQAVRKMVEVNRSIIGLALSPEEAYSLKKQGKLTAFLGIENGYAIGRDLSLIKHFYDLGVRYITLCHSSDNDICDSSTDRSEPEDKGLSDFGRQVVRECNRVGMIIDISHASDRSFYDVLKASQAPIIASHSCARAVCDNPRNLTDDMIRALAARGGVVQICFLSAYVKKPQPNPERDKALAEFRAKYGNWRNIQDEDERRKIMEEMQELNRRYPADLATVRDLVDHIDHVVRLVGVDYVGIGTDFDGGGGVVGCNDVSQMINVTVELLRRGYSQKDIEKIWGKNFFRVFNQVREVSRKLRQS
ncbi:MAG: dipeptidase [Candidatus Saccharicenans sp.]|jgi:membrane dipeptidase|nr:dipeptidase [Candidatus Saccharicenans sp.]MDH7574551.1 dipeptidase [Candidatus Saccharicenans sp.]